MKYSHTIRVFACLQFPICLEHYNTIGFLYCTYLCYTNYSLRLNLNMYLNNLGVHAFCPMTYLYKLCVLCEQFPIICYYVISFLHLCTYYLCYATYSLLLNLTTYLSTYAFYHTYLYSVSSNACLHYYGYTSTLMLCGVLTEPSHVALGVVAMSRGDDRVLTALRLLCVAPVCPSACMCGRVTCGACARLRSTPLYCIYQYDT